MKDGGEFIFRFKVQRDPLRNSSQTLLNFHILLLIAPSEIDQYSSAQGPSEASRVQSREDLG